MESEKVKEVKKALDICRHANIEPCRECPYNYTNTKTKHSECFRMAEHALTLIKELESENAELKKYKLDWLNGEKMHLQAELEETEFELSSSNRLFEIVCKENKQLKDRIDELEKENAKYKRKLTTNQWVQEIRKEALKQFAERLRYKLGDYDTIRDYVMHELIDETLKEFIEE